MTSADGLTFTVRHNPEALSAERRAELMAQPVFGRVATDHMVMIRYSDEKGWHDAEVSARRPLQIDPAASVLHYAQEIFEGLKAFPTADGGAAIFRPDANAKRFRQSAERMAMPQLPEELFLASIDHLVKIDREWVPRTEGGSLYLRPFMFANDAFLGVRPASEYLFLTIASPVGPYFSNGAVTVWVSETWTRAASGGTGAAKCGGNYAASLIAQAEAKQHNCDQVVFLDAAEHRFVEEMGGMNIFFVFKDGSIATPPLGGTILPGITRDSLLTLARERGLTVRETLYSLDEWLADAESGNLVECFACGTAAAVSPIGKVKTARGEVTIGSGSAGQVTTMLKNTLLDIQRGRANDTHKWVHQVF
ncbi:MAG: branched-chain amino acid aminotransferase [Acetobacter sp.]|nr:branched-chain amino acid aminotransferase [Acetobacter sp.]MCH4062384.1 branched-chain amino acid aminotransferase [Acetobacter sp.]MCH4088769.1 branched-chain amino acid aminotransferase [Acetobacter sp.]MCI1292674.1 branched-chain amino acid aminotransferase [Acetobacter sp.]MCI1319226.1 branched-chain amino acid aminotransferase [Acetobacter sp.]